MLPKPLPYFTVPPALYELPLQLAVSSAQFQNIASCAKQQHLYAASQLMQCSIAAEFGSPNAKEIAAQVMQWIQDLCKVPVLRFQASKSMLQTRNGDIPSDPLTALQQVGCASLHTSFV